MLCAHIDCFCGVAGETLRIFRTQVVDWLSAQLSLAMVLSDHQLFRLFSLVLCYLNKTHNGLVQNRKPREQGNPDVEL